uniref:40S ribosomal protein S15 (RPS15D) n=1 Tax=Arundo donax TaxID=35708 RepID=A0A0A9TMX8_ARUDO
MTSLERDEQRRVGGTNTRPTMLDWLVRDGEFCHVVANHLRLDLHLVKGPTIVDADDTSNISGTMIML